jgi:hypothetical protein
MKTLTLAAAILLVACGGPERTTTPTTTSDTSSAPKAAPPSAAEAKQIIGSSPDFSDYEFTNAAFTLPMQRSTMTGPVASSANDLVRAGWIDIPGNMVVLTAKSKTDKRFIVRPNGFLDIVPIAKKELGEVTNVHPNTDGTIAAEFDWKWIPNEVGSAFRSGPLKERFDAPQSATATLMHGADGWSVLRIDARRPPGLPRPPGFHPPTRVSGVRSQVSATTQPASNVARAELRRGLRPDT